MKKILESRNQREGKYLKQRKRKRKRIKVRNKSIMQMGKGVIPFAQAILDKMKQ